MTRPERNPADPTFLINCHSRNDHRLFSGISYYLAEQGIRDGLLTGMANLFPRGLGALPVYAAAARWKLTSGRRFPRQGFVYTEMYLDAIWERHLPNFSGSRVISNFQLFGPYFHKFHRTHGIVPYLYFDASLHEYFSAYAAYDTAGLDDDVKSHAFEIEREGYAVARTIVVMSRRSAAALREIYGVASSKLRVVPPGANIPDPMLESFDRQDEPHRHRAPGSLVVGFVGLYPLRKGLPVIADAIKLLRREGYDARLHIIGNCPEEIARQEGVAYFGRVDKRTDMDRFVQIVGAVDIGCMLSRAELAGVALCEFLRLGVPVVATDVGGIPDIVALGAGQLISPGASAEDLASLLASYITDRKGLLELQHEAWVRRHNASWKRAVAGLRLVLDGETVK